MRLQNSSVRRLHPATAYAADPVFTATVRKIVGNSWIHSMNGIWVYFTPEGEPELAADGWKVHVSAHPGNAQLILELAVAVLVDLKIPFKFLADENILRRSTGKNWERAASGKFMTAYPVTMGRCRVLMERISLVLRDQDGPYVLSDRRFQDSRCVYYRYGVINADLAGPQRLVKNGLGGREPDPRGVPFRLPTGMNDPFKTFAPSSTSTSADHRLAGRWRVLRAIHHQPAGSAYIVQDEKSGDGLRYLLKEARPFTDFGMDGLDAIGRLNHEAQVLQALESTGITPRFIDRFSQWENEYLVEEFVGGKVLQDAVVPNNHPLMIPNLSADAAVDYTTWLQHCWHGLAAAVERIHASGWCIGDLNLRNIILSGQEPLGTLRLIDLESYFRPKDGERSWLGEPGIASREHMNLGAVGPEDDIFAMVACCLQLIMPVSRLRSLSPSAWKDVILLAARYLPIHSELLELPISLLQRDRRPEPTEAIELLATIRDIELIAPASLSKQHATLPGRKADLLRMTGESCRQLLDIALDGGGMFLPSREYLNDKHESMLFGVAGLALGLEAAGHHEDAQKAIRFALESIDNATPIGLYTGAGGVLWVAGELLGHESIAEQLARYDEHQVDSSFADLDLSLMSGMAGELLFWLHHSYGQTKGVAASRARQIADSLVTLVNEQELKFNQIGLGRGMSGVASALAYAYSRLGSEDIANAASRFIRMDLDLILRHLGRSTATKTRSVPRNSIYSANWLDGSVGVLLAVHSLQVSGIEVDIELNELLAPTLTSVSTSPGYITGMSGIGSVLAVMHQPGLDLETTVANQVAAVSAFLFQDSGVLLAPGADLSTAAGDFAHGVAGITAFFGAVVNRSAFLGLWPTNPLFVQGFPYVS